MNNNSTKFTKLSEKLYLDLLILPRKQLYSKQLCFLYKELIFYYIFLTVNHNTKSFFPIPIKLSDLAIGSLFRTFGEWMSDRQRCSAGRFVKRQESGARGAEERSDTVVSIHGREEEKRLRISRWMTWSDLPSRYRARYRCEELWKSAGGLSPWPSYIISKGSPGVYSGWFM